MTVVIAIQALVAALAGLLLFEARCHRDEQASASSWGDVSTAPIEFHAELIVRWDDEADYAPSTRCSRKPTVDHVAAVRPQLTMSRSNTHNR